MTKRELTVESLKAKGYRDYQFTSYGMEQVVRDIKNGIIKAVKIEPGIDGNSMVAVVSMTGSFDRSSIHYAFWRPITAEEKVRYATEIEASQKKLEAFTAKTNARNIKKIRRGR